MTVSSIFTTVSSVVAEELGGYAASSYSPAIAKVSEALAEREYAVVDAIVEAAVERFGYSAYRDEIVEILTTAGLAQRPAPVVPEPVVVEPPFEAPELKEDESVTADDVAKGKLSKGERIAKLEEGQAAILEAIKGLTSLANRHLGADL